MEEHENTWPEIAAGTDREVGPAAKYDIFGIPLSIILDHDGEVVAVDVRGEELDEVIAHTLNIKNDKE